VSETGGEKGKKQEAYDQIPWQAMDHVARVYGYGEQKYAAFNWLQGYSWRLSFAAAFRHLSAACSGEWEDSESGLPHLAHAVFHMLALMTFHDRGLGTDDRMPRA
jgi:hypothetical protein